MHHSLEWAGPSQYPSRTLRPLTLRLVVDDVDVVVVVVVVVFVVFVVVVAIVVVVFVVSETVVDIFASECLVDRSP